MLAPRATWARSTIIPDAELSNTVRDLNRLILAAGQHRQSVCAAAGIGDTEGQALEVLALRGPCGQVDIARDLMMTSSATTALVDRLERRDLARRVRDRSDRRRVVVHLTGRGREIVEQSQQCLDRALHELAPTGLESFADSLAVVADQMSAAAPSSAAVREISVA